MKLIASKKYFRGNRKKRRVGACLSMFSLFWVCFLSVNILSVASTTAGARDGGILKYLPEGAIETLFGLEENVELKDVELNSNLDKFVIIHSHNFENNTVGSYSDTEKRRDYGTLDYDNRPGYPQIANFDGGKRAKHYFPYGSSNGKNGSDFGAVIKNPSDEVYYSFRVYYEPGFDFYISGKLPGFRMWPSIPAGSGRNPGNGGGVVYLQVDAFGRMNWNVYHHKMSSGFGERMGTPINFYTIKTGEWIDVTYRIVLNTPGQSNGILQVWINGELKNTATNVMLRTKTSVQDLNQQVVITAMDWDVPVRRNQSMYMDDFYTWKYSPDHLSKNPSVARGFNLHSTSHKLVTPLDQNVEEAATYSITAPASPSNGGKVTVVRSSGND